MELRKGNVEQAKSNFLQASRLASFLFEPVYNVGYLYYKRGEFQQSFVNVKESLKLFPEHADSKELLKNLQRHFAII